MKRASCLLIAGLLMLVITPMAHAWNRIGHMAVAGIAYDKLTEAEQKKLVEILGHLPNNEHMLAGLATDSVDPRDLVMAASTWPDLIKTDTARYFHNGYNEPGPLQSISASVGAENGKLPMHKGWHFIDTPYHIDTKKDGPALDGSLVNIVQVLTVLDKQLKQPTDKAEQAYEMAWVLHLVGDIHQPLHCMNGIDDQNPKGDTGGNDIVTEDPITHERELHAFWDDILGKDTSSKKKGAPPRLDLDVVKASNVISTISKPTLPAHATAIDFQKWADATHKLAVDDAYGELHFTVIEQPHGDGEKPADSVTIDQEYHDMANRVAQKQVYLAGCRLAVLLKGYLKD